MDIIDFQELIDYRSLENIDEIMESEIVKIKKCPGPFTNLSIACNGDMLPCCTEFGRKMVLGNIADMSLLEAWNSNKMKNIRESFLKGDLLSICQHCIS